MIDNCEFISFRVDTLIDGSGWITQRPRFPCHDEAQMYALEFGMRWRYVKQTRVVPSTDNITVRWAEGRLEPVKPGDVA